MESLKVKNEFTKIIDVMFEDKALNFLGLEI